MKGLLRYKKIFFRPKVYYLTAAFLVVMTGQFQPLAALSIDADFYSSNDILFYNPDAQTCTDGTGTANLVGNSNAEKIWNFLTGKGLSAEQAAGVMGNLQQESNFNPDAREPNGIGYGIAQWSFGRRTQLEAAAAQKNIPVSDLGFQLDFLYQEATTRPAKNGGGNEWEVLKQKTTIETALVFWQESFERSADSAQKVITVRGGYAQNAYASFKSITPGAATSPSGGCGNTAVSGNFEQLVLAYAWPKFSPGPYTDKQPAYETAIQKARSEGKYIGGIKYPGVDCGGFITTLLINSGFEPNYNYGGLISQGAGPTGTQETWAKANWTSLGSGSSINTSDLKPGDVAFTPGHSFIYTGTIPGFDGVVASSSLDDRAPMASKESLTQSNVSWYRKK